MTTDTPTIDGDTLDALESHLTEHAVGRDNAIVSDTLAEVIDTQDDHDTNPTVREAEVCHCKHCGKEYDAERLVDAIAAEAEDYRIDDTKLAAQVVQRLDYGELARAVADELEGRFR